MSLGRARGRFRAGLRHDSSTERRSERESAVRYQAVSLDVASTALVDTRVLDVL